MRRGVMNFRVSSSVLAPSLPKTGGRVCACNANDATVINRSVIMFFIFSVVLGVISAKIKIFLKDWQFDE
jgi:hypothetical protein